MIVRIEELDYNAETGRFHCPDHPHQQLEPITWAGTGYVCEATMTMSQNNEVECLNFAQWSSLEVRDEEINRVVRLAMQETSRAMGTHMPWMRLQTSVRQLFNK